MCNYLRLALKEFQTSNKDFVSSFGAEPTCRFDGLPSYCDLHRRADQDPYSVVLWVQQLVPGFKRETNRETSQEGWGDGG